MTPAQLLGPPIPVDRMAGLHLALIDFMKERNASPREALQICMSFQLRIIEQEIAVGNTPTQCCDDMIGLFQNFKTHLRVAGN